MSIKDNTLSLQSILNNVNSLPTKSDITNNIIKSDADLIPENIKKDVEILGVTGSYEGVELNFEVVGGTEEPSNPKENTIWVNTDTPIAGWHFSSEQPDNLAEGAIWFISTQDTKLHFLALKKNPIEVFVRNAKQMVSGNLVTVEFKIYKNGKWMSSERILFAPGANINQFINGGQSNSGYSFNSDSISMWSASQYYCGFAVSYADPIELSGFKSMTATITGNVTGDARVYLVVSSDLVTYTGTVVASCSALSINGEQTITLMIDDDAYSNGKFYVGVLGIFCSINLLDWRLA